MKARFFRSDAMSEKWGEIAEVVVEADWFQLTYDELRISPDGDPLATFNSRDQDSWVMNGLDYSDVVIYEEV